MSTILLSINPEYVDKIFNGEKKYEFRKIRCKRQINKILIYETVPTKKIVGEANVAEVLQGIPEMVWESTKNAAGISKEYFDKYYKNKEVATAYKLINVIKYKEPLSLEKIGIKSAPQSFMYIND